VNAAQLKHARCADFPRRIARRIGGRIGGRTIIRRVAAMRNPCTSATLPRLS
jgi:hypothetical protein